MLPKDRNERALDLVLLATSTTLGYLGVLHDRSWAVGLAVLSVMNHFGHRRVAEQFDITRTNLITFGLGFFTMFAVNAVLEMPDD